MNVEKSLNKLKDKISKVITTDYLKEKKVSELNRE